MVLVLEDRAAAAGVLDGAHPLAAVVDDVEAQLPGQVLRHDAEAALGAATARNGLEAERPSPTAARTEDRAGDALNGA